MVDLAQLHAANPTVENTVVSVRNFKSFGAAGFELQGLRRLNLVVGRNNVGKSSIIDAIRILCGEAEADATHGHRGKAPSFVVSTIIGQDIAQAIYPPNTSGGWIGGNHWTAIGKPLSESGISVELKAAGKGRPTFVELIPSDALKSARTRDRHGNLAPLTEAPDFTKSLPLVSERISNPYSPWKTFRIAAERDVIQEPRNGPLSLQQNGSGLTNIISQVITSTKYDSSLVEREYLDQVNSILNPDMHIQNIRVQEHDNQRWEVFFDEAEKGIVSLSNSGSGLKTVLIIVAATYLLPRLGLLPSEGIIFLIEEPENNLHPALQRRLAAYLFDVVSDTNNKIVATSHSSAIIDAFSTQRDAQIINVTNRSGETTTEIVDNKSGRRSVLDELDARASDLLLSNGVIWVEGPSDRIYLNKWIELLTDGKVKEGIHYQCVFYGGKLLSHLAADLDAGDDITQYVNIFHVSRNAAVIIDSDKSDDDSDINSTKKRISQEVASSGGLEWVTHGREIENYLTLPSFSRLDPRMDRAIGRYEEIEEYLKATVGESDATRMIRSKSHFAALITDQMVREDIEAGSPLLADLEGLITAIRRWNGLPDYVDA